MCTWQVEKEKIIEDVICSLERVNGKMEDMFSNILMLQGKRGLYMLGNWFQQTKYLLVSGQGCLYEKKKNKLGKTWMMEWIYWEQR